jgi:hypothetical protein
MVVYPLLIRIRESSLKIEEFGRCSCGGYLVMFEQTITRQEVGDVKVTRSVCDKCRLEYQHVTYMPDFVVQQIRFTRSFKI